MILLGVVIVVLILFGAALGWDKYEFHLHNRDKFYDKN